MTAQEREITKALEKIEAVQEEIVKRGLDDTLCKYWGSQIEGAIYKIKSALEK